MDNIFLLTGGNLGDRKANLQQAALLIEQLAGTIITKSHIYQTAAWGKTNQPSFLNQVLQLRTEFTPHHLLSVLLGIEVKMGRQRLEKYGARIIDIDMLFFNGEVTNTENLVVPHPQIQNRRFVLVPMAEVAHGFIHPMLNKSMQQLLAECPDELAVNLYEE